MLKTEIAKYLKKTVKEKVLIEIFPQENEKFGHYSSNAALRLAGTKRKNPLVIAEEIVAKLKLIPHLSFLVSRIEVVPPGFINFWISKKALQNELKKILKKGGNYGAGSKKKNKVQVEFISANPTGPLTIGNGRGGFLGDVLANILTFQGNKVVKEFYINDGKVCTQIKELGKTAMGQGTTYLTKNLKSQITKIRPAIQKIKSKKTQNIKGEIGYLLAQRIQRDNQAFIEKKLKIKFDNWFNEESLFKSKAVEKLLKELKKKNLIYNKDGAIWFKSKKFGDDEDRVIIRSSGDPSYFLPDLAYHLNKFKVRQFNKVIEIWGADHYGYVPRLKAGLNSLGIPENKIAIIITQLIKLTKGGKEVRMSKRKGEYVTLEDLIKEIGLDASRFFFLMYSPDTHMNFNLDLAKERSMKNPVYYVQYAAVRCESILRKSKIKSQKLKVDLGLLNTGEDLNLIKTLARFPEIVEEAAENYNPQILVRYSLNLARSFHNFYEKERVLGEEKNLALARLSLIQATLIVFKSVFKILGINLPKKM
jgi:arginyl-tRNA synthetase